MPTNSLSESLHGLIHVYKKHMKDAIRAEKITLPISHIRVLKGISVHPQCTAQDVVKVMQRDKAQITRTLNELQNDDLINKVDNPDDGRSQLLLLTGRGKRLMTRLNSVEEQVAARMTQTLSSHDIDAFMRIANVMSNSINQHSKNH